MDETRHSDARCREEEKIGPTQNSLEFSDKSAASDSWHFVGTFFKMSEDFRAEILQNAGKVQNAVRLD